MGVISKMNKYEKALRRIKQNKYCEGMGHSTVGMLKKTNDFNLLLELCKHDKLAPKKVIKETDEFGELKLIKYSCPRCRNKTYKFCGNRYCPYCGQALDWSNKNER